MFRRALLALVLAVSAIVLPVAAKATTFGFGFVIDFQNGDGAIGVGKLFTTDNGDDTFTITGAHGLATYVNLSTWNAFGDATITDVGPSLFAPVGSVPTITFASGQYSFDNLALFGDGLFYDFSHFFGPALIGVSGEVGGPAQFQFGPLAVPEAATWAMMVMGFGVLGMTLRRRRALLRLA
jgi:hypothetical protein